MARRGSGTTVDKFRLGIPQEYVNACCIKDLQEQVASWRRSWATHGEEIRCSQCGAAFVAVVWDNQWRRTEAEKEEIERRRYHEQLAMFQKAKELAEEET